MPIYTLTIKIKSGKRTEFNAWVETWGKKTIPLKGTDHTITNKSAGEFMTKELKEFIASSLTEMDLKNN